jgi:hypothetical protein
MLPESILILGQSGFPSPGKLAELNREGVRHLINVSGIDLLAVYGQESAAGFSLEQYAFKDVFSVGLPISANHPVETIPADLYVRQSLPGERAAFCQAVGALSRHLERNEPTFVFCHKGVGRSPCVVAAAMAYCHGADFPEIMKLLRFLNRHALFTDVSCAAVKWCVGQLAGQEGHAGSTWTH